MKPIIFFDFDGTLCFDRYWRSLPPEQFERVQQLIFGSNRDLLEEWMLGGRTAEEINQIVAEHLRIPYDELWKLFVNDCETMNVSKTTLEKILLLRDRYICILITGNMDSFTRFTVPALNLDKYFDYINNSYSVRKHKGDNGGTQFVEYAKMLGTKIDECFLIDDSMKNCLLFEKLGGIAYHISPEYGIDAYLAKFS